jgi:hypothetical protein
MGQFGPALLLLEEALALAEKGVGPAHKNTRTIMNRLATLRRETGEPDEDLCRRLLALRETALGASHPETVASMNDLASLLAGQAVRQRAQESLDNEFAAGEASAAAAADAALGIKAWKQQTAEDEAREAREAEAAQAAREEAAAAEADKAAAAARLAANEADPDWEPESVLLCRQALLLREQQLGPMHKSTLISMLTLSNTLLQAKRPDEELARRVVALHRKVCGARCPRTLTAMASLANLLNEAGRPDEALARQVLVLQEEKLGLADGGTLMSMFNLALLLKAVSAADPRDRHKIKEAAEILQRARPLFAKCYGANHVYTDRVKRMIVLCASQEHNLYAEANGQLQRVSNV